MAHATAHQRQSPVSVWNGRKPGDWLDLRGQVTAEALVGVEPTMADLQSAALASWLQRRARNSLLGRALATVSSTRLAVDCHPEHPTKAAQLEQPLLSAGV